MIDFFRIFGIHSFLRSGYFVEYMNMHELMQLTVRIGLCTHGVTTMLGVSLRARRHTTLVTIIFDTIVMQKLNFKQKNN